MKQHEMTCVQTAERVGSEESTAGNPSCWGAITLLACGHLSGDFYGMLLTPLLQDFREAFALSVTGATILVNVASLSNSMLQPIAGHFLERFDQKHVFAMGVLIATVLLSCIGLASDPIWLGALLALGGVGVALFHPSGAVLTGRFAGARPGLAMSIYANGGAVGIALAPLAVTLLLLQTTRQMTWVFMPLGLVMAAAAIWFIPTTPSPAQPPKLPNWRSLFHPDSRSVWLVFVSVVLRALVVAVVTSFLVIYSAEKGWSKSEGRFLLTAFLLACAAGGVLGGYVSDFLERRRLMLAACFLSFPPLVAAWQVSYGGALALLVLSGATLSLSTPINIVVAQELHPDRASAMSGVMMGLAWSVSVLLLIPFGTLADLTSTATALNACSLLLPIAGLVILPLPEFPPP